MAEETLRRVFTIGKFLHFSDEQLVGFSREEKLHDCLLNNCKYKCTTILLGLLACFFEGGEDQSLAFVVDYTS